LCGETGIRTQATLTR